MTQRHLLPSAYVSNNERPPRPHVIEFLVIFA